MVCPECGKENSVDRSFCANCGDVLGGTTQVVGPDADATVIVPPKSSEPPPTESAEPEKQVESDKAAQSESNQPPKKETREEALLKKTIKGKYELHGRLGAGGMATVYLAVK